VLLEIQNLSAYYWGPDRLALNDINLMVNPGEIIALLGSNGAGKSSVLKVIFGELHIHQGEVRFLGSDITQKNSSILPRLGLGIVPEGRRLFGSLTVAENLELGGFTLADSRKVAANKEKVYQLFPFLTQYLKKRAETLSGGEQQMLAISRALMARPRLLLLDEPSLGLGPIFVKLIFDIIRKINTESRTTIFLVEQNAHMALKVAHRGYVMENGRITLEGSADTLLHNEDVKKAYLGI
jgi:branched-chain amino acid transport system ATP-binding protein